MRRDECGVRGYVYLSLDAPREGGSYTPAIVTLHSQHFAHILNNWRDEHDGYEERDGTEERMEEMAKKRSEVERGEEEI